MRFWDGELYDSVPEYYKVRNLLESVVLLAIKEKDFRFLKSKTCENYCSFINKPTFNYEHFCWLVEKYQKEQHNANGP